MQGMLALNDAAPRGGRAPRGGAASSSPTTRHARARQLRGRRLPPLGQGRHSPSRGGRGWLHCATRVRHPDHQEEHGMTHPLRARLRRPRGRASASSRRAGRSPSPTWSRSPTLTGDWHPQHVDADWAAASRFGERIAHGMLVLSYAVGLCRSTPSGWSRCARVGDVVFKRPVRIGDTIHVEGEHRVARTEIDDATASSTCRWRIVQPGRRAGRAAPGRAWSGAAPRRRPESRSRARDAAVILEGKRLLVTGRRQPPQHRLRGRRARPGGGRRGGPDQLRPRAPDDRARATRLPRPPDVLELDVNSDEDLAALREELERALGQRRRRAPRDRVRARRTRSAATS